MMSPLQWYLIIDTLADCLEMLFDLFVMIFELVYKYI